MSRRGRRGGVTAATRVPGYILAVLLVVMLVVAVVVWLVNGEKRQFTVMFTNSTGLYVGDRVMVLGVPVGKVDKITPSAQGVAVDVTVDSGREIPADTKAAIVAPTLVTGRYVQFSPAYTGGPELADGATVPVTRTATPMEFDQTKQQLVDLVKQVGPTSTDQRGALNRFLNTTAKTTGGNGESLRLALIELSRATGTLQRGSGNLFTTIRNLSTVTSSLATADDQIRGFTSELADFSGVLDDNRDQLDQVLTALQSTFVDLKTLIDQNHAALATDVSHANTITGLLVDRIDTLANILQVLPTAASDFYNIYDPVGKSLTGALGVPDFPDGQSLLCALLTTVNAPEGQCATTTRQLATNSAAAGALAGIRQATPQTPQARQQSPAPPGLPGLLNPTTRGGQN
ncbi:MULTISPECIES: MCE family protein [unclassified Gordonia (in: high G+C Gram-positive bacteria)]|uniref:MCE family protein n=1 Tax=unclassified Gordonia (in: high G+C Gram-positive bacteria) TaxID=2657482 RepID=UPI0009AE3BEF|nr:MULTISPECIES: MCE family protein [unclassified Gordonia (in: high G+C Gram-positive bacteria)]MDF3284151.1 MCE family protein [Gordonia sp. N1V]OPX16592.1 mammalian cell entry protein [Gordonia sp. i37]